MPNYSYLCEECNITTEFFHKMEEEKILPCPKCKKIMQKKITLGQKFILKGTGWDKKPSLPKNDE